MNYSNDHPTRLEVGAVFAAGSLLGIGYCRAALSDGNGWPFLLSAILLLLVSGLSETGGRRKVNKLGGINPELASPPDRDCHRSGREPARDLPLDEGGAVSEH